VAPTLIYEEGNIIKRSIRDLYQRGLDKIIVQGKEAYKDARSFMKTFTPSHVKKIELHEDSDVPIFHKYDVEEKIGKILNPSVSLPSGGSIVINVTEALTAIDVNSGKSKNERNIEETALKTNLEAIPEIARQIKLRDIAGIIVIDFIDMMDRQANVKVEKKMLDAMKNDSSDIQITKLSQFGLMEISRQRLKKSLVDSNFVQCKHCAGYGKILSTETIALSVIRKIENFLSTQSAESLIVEVASGVDLFILNQKRKLLAEMEAAYNTSIEIIRSSVIELTDCKITIKEYKISDITDKLAVSHEQDTTSKNKQKAPQHNANKKNKTTMKNNEPVKNNEPMKNNEPVKKDKVESLSKETHHKQKKPKEQLQPKQSQNIQENPVTDNKMDNNRTPNKADNFKTRTIIDLRTVTNQSKDQFLPSNINAENKNNEMYDVTEKKQKRSKWLRKIFAK
jgi:ribonuclease E